jgi:hypothetical protein
MTATHEVLLELTTYPAGQRRAEVDVEGDDSIETEGVLVLEVDTNIAKVCDGLWLPEDATTWNIDGVGEGSVSVIDTCEDDPERGGDGGVGFADGTVISTMTPNSHQDLQSYYE